MSKHRQKYYICPKNKNIEDFSAIESNTIPAQ